MSLCYKTYITENTLNYIDLYTIYEEVGSELLDYLEELPNYYNVTAELIRYLIDCEVKFIMTQRLYEITVVKFPYKVLRYYQYMKKSIIMNQTSFDYLMLGIYKARKYYNRTYMIDIVIIERKIKNNLDYFDNYLQHNTARWCKTLININSKYLLELTIDKFIELNINFEPLINNITNIYYIRNADIVIQLLVKQYPFRDVYFVSLIPCDQISVIINEKIDDIKITYIPYFEKYIKKLLGNKMINSVAISRPDLFMNCSENISMVRMWKLNFMRCLNRIDNIHRLIVKHQMY